MNDSPTEAHARRKKRPSRGKLAAAAAVVVAAAGAGIYYVVSSGTKEPEYLFAPVVMGNVEDLVTATGTLQPRDYVDVGAQTSGQIERILVEVGDVVKKGDLLVTIDAETSQARMEANEASLASSKNNLLTQRANLEKAERDLKRLENLFAADAATEEQVLNARTTFANAQRQVTSSELQIAQQEANMRIEKKNLAYTSITAPIDGTVMSIAVKVGQSVNASQSVPNVMRIANLNTMTVNSEVSEADIAKVEKGMPVYFTALGSNRRWYGTVKRREPTPKTQNSVVLYPVLFDVENEDSSLMPNQTAQVFFVAAEARNVLTVPMAALQQGQQIAREMAMKEREANQAANAGRDGERNAGGAGPDAGPGAAPGAAPPAMANAGSAPAAATMPAGAGGGVQGNAQAGRAGAGAEGAPGNNRFNGGQGGARQGGGRQGGGGFGGFNPDNMTPEQLEQLRARMRERGGGGGGGPGGFGPGGFGGMGMAGGGSGRQQQRRGTVMVKKADGTLEARQVVIGVSDRVHGQVLEGLTEGEEVVIGRSEQEAEAPASTQNNNQNNQNFRPDNFRGGGGGGFRPF